MWWRAYQGEGPADAYLVRDWLERNGIRTWLRGEGLIGVRGGPFGVGWPGVWVPESDKWCAEVVLREFHAPALVHPDWVCRCGESNAPAFGACWSCGAER
jgi:hypothetical protein